MKKNIFINNSWLLGNGEKISSFSPWTHEELWTGFEPSVEQIQESINSAKNGFNNWKLLNFSDRLKFLENFIELVKKNSDEFSKIIALEAGKPLWEATQEVGAIQGKLSATIQAYKLRASNIKSEIIIQGQQGTVETVFVPYGVVVVLGPYNFPVHMANGHIIPALLAGNSVIYKCSEYGIASSLFYTKLMQESGMPNGVFSFLPGNGEIGNQLIEHDDVRAVYFTGSEPVGRHIREYCSTKNKRCAIEAGGNSSIYVEDYQQEDKLFEIIIQSAYWGAGQRCNNARNLILNKKIATEAFFEKLSKKIDSIQILNDYINPASFYGPMRRKIDTENLLNAQDDLEKKGAHIICRSTSHYDNQLLLHPSFVIMPKKASLYPAELVGPMLRTHIVENVEEAVSLINKTPLRLAAGLISESTEIFNYFAENCNFGGISWNCPTSGASGYASFGGFGESGNNSPAGFLSIDYCVSAKSIMKAASV